MPTLIEKMNRVVSQLRDATGDDGEKVFAEVYLGSLPILLEQQGVTGFPCAIVAVEEANSLRITALLPTDTAENTETCIIMLAEAASKAMGYKYLSGPFGWEICGEQVYRIWQRSVSV